MTGGAVSTEAQAPFVLSADQRTLRESTRAFAIDRIRPIAMDIDRRNVWPDKLWDDIRYLGVTGIAFDEAVGGGGGSYLDFVIVIEELARESAAAALLPAVNVLAARALDRFGTASVRERFLSGLITGEIKACWAFTEPATGSDPKSIETVATEASRGWRISGRKAFISHSSVADIAVVFAVVEGRLSAFVVDAGQPGFQPGRRYDLLGLRGADTGDLVLDDVEVGKGALLGDLGDGMHVLVAIESEAKVRSAAMSVGMAQSALDEALAYGRERLHRGKPIADKFAAVQGLLADISIAVESARALTYHAASMRDAGLGDFTYLAAVAKSHAAKSAVDATRLAMQVHGAYGYTNEFPISRVYRDAKAYEMIQGSAEIQRTIIARSILGRSRG